MTPLIRPALAGDQPAIIALVRQERLNPTNLDWRRFTVAVQEGAVIGAVQVRQHRDGAQELGSLVVARAYRGQGIARKLIDAALASVTGPVWMMTGRAHVRHYADWDFDSAQPAQAPRSVRFNYRIGRAARIISWLQRLEPTNLTMLVRR